MSKIVQKRELQEDGHYQVSSYDTETQKLTHRWYENQNGKKDGEELEFNYTGKVHRVTDWKNGKKDGIEICFNTGISIEDLEETKSRCNKGDYAYISFLYVTNWKDDIKHGEEIITDLGKNLTARSEYNNGQQIKNIQYLYKLTPEIEQFLKDVRAPWLSNPESIYIKKDGIKNEILYIEMNKPARHYVHEYTGFHYAMKFKDGKEYDGDYRYHHIRDQEHYSLKEGKLNGSFWLENRVGSYWDGKFSGEETISITDTPLGNNIEDLKNFTNQWTIENKGIKNASKIIHADKVSGYKIKTAKEEYDIPLNGNAHLENYGIVIDCEIKDGKLNGLYKAFGDKVLDGDCSFKKECSYKDGVLDGDYTETRERIIPHEAYRNGIKEKIEIKCQYKNGELDGIYEEVKQPAEDVAYQYRYKYKNTFEYKDGVLDGVYINEEERVSTHYKEGKLDGKYVKFSSKNNQKETEKEYKDGKLNGICIEYDEYGFKTVESTYKDDVLDGPYKEYFRNGKPKCEGSYSNGEKNGFWKTYVDNGDLIEMRRFENDKDVTERYNKLKKIASKRIDKEKAIEAETGVKTRLPKMSKGAKVVAMVKESLGLSK